MTTDPSTIIDKLIAAGPVRHRFSSNFVKNLVIKAENVIKKEPTLLRLKAPMIVVGDLHGQYSDLLRVFKVRIFVFWSYLSF